MRFWHHLDRVGQRAPGRFLFLVALAMAVASCEPAGTTVVAALVAGYLAVALAVVYWPLPRRKRPGRLTITRARHVAGQR